MLCILCTLTSDQMLNIFDENGTKLNMCKIISTHFWLQPDPKLNNSKCICLSCWNTLASFHEFYEQIEKTHMEHLKHLSKESDQESNNFDSFSGLFSTVVKQENLEYSNEVAEQPEAVQSNDVVKSEKEEETQKSDPESESEVLLMKLSSSYKNEDCEESKDNHSDSEEEDESTQDNDNQQSDFESYSDSEYSYPKKKAKTKNSSTKNEDGIKRLSCKEFDSFIKKNMDLSCNICAKSVDNFFELKEHFSKVHKTQAFVTCCDKQWNSRFSLVHHLLLHQDPDMYKCKKCSRVLANKKSFRNHMNTHVTQELVHECTKCNKKFSSIPKLEKHMNSHSRRYTDQICEQCGKVCHSKQSLTAHQKREHLGFVKQRVQCTKCGVYLAEASTLRFHMKYLHPKTKVVNECHLCGKISATAYGLKRHIQYMHTMKRIHKCTICEDKAFKTAQMLRV